MNPYINGMSKISLWLCWGVQEIRLHLIVAFGSPALFALVALIFLFTTLCRFSMGLRSALVDGQLVKNNTKLITAISGTFGCTGRGQVRLEYEISLFMTPVSREKHQVF